MERRAGHPAMLTIALGFGNGSSVWFLGSGGRRLRISGALASFIMIVLAGASEGRRSGPPRGETE